MSEELLEIIQPIIEPRILLREQKALDSGIKTGIAGAVKMLRKMGCEDSKIETMIMEQFNLTAEEANGYL